MNRTNCVKWDSISPIYDGTKTKSVKGFASEGTVWRNEPQLISAVARTAKIEEFMTLIWRRDLAGIEAALNKDPSLINAKDATSGETALAHAADDGYKDVVELLLAKGADVNARDNSGYTPMFSAEANKHKDVVKLLRQHGGVSCGAVRNC